VARWARPCAQHDRPATRRPRSNRGRTPRRRPHRGGHRPRLHNGFNREHRAAAASAVIVFARATPRQRTSPTARPIAIPRSADPTPSGGGQPGLERASTSAKPHRVGWDLRRSPPYCGPTTELTTLSWSVWFFEFQRREERCRGPTAGRRPGTAGIRAHRARSPAKTRWVHPWRRRSPSCAPRASRSVRPWSPQKMAAGTRDDSRCTRGGRDE